MQKCRHPFILQAQMGAFTMSQELCQVGAQCINPNLGDMQNPGLFVMPLNLGGNRDGRWNRS